MIDLPLEHLERLKEAARSASQHAYCPYSSCRVGAAALMSSGRFYSGCNAENVSFGLTMCAERNALFQAVAAGERTVRAVAVYTPTAEPTTPCGACLQVIQEFGPDALIICFSDGPQVRQFDLRSLLPHPFAKLPTDESSP